jgi:predicted CoA-binding protein
MLTDEVFDRALLEAELSASSDPRTPGAEEMYEIVRRTIRIAVVGISRDPSKAARRVPSYLATRGADIIPVNPHAERIFGREVKRSLDEVDEEVDMVLVFRPSDEAGDVVREATRRPEKPVIWLQEGIRNDDAADEAREAGFTVIQDLCLYKVHRALGDTLRRSGRTPG